MHEITAYDPDGKPCTDTVIVDAPSPGVAIEYFLACHGMMQYWDIALDEVDSHAYEGYMRKDVDALFRGMNTDGLDGRHVWRSHWSSEWPEPGVCWFYGQTHKSVEPELLVVDIYSSYGFTDDRTIYASEVCGVWRPYTMRPPAIPEGD